MDMYEAKKSADMRLCESVCKVLTSHGFKAYAVKDSEEALKTALELIPEKASVGVPGTVTIRQIGLIQALEERASKVYVHWDPALTAETRPQRHIDQLTSDWFVTSTNALSADEGAFVNIDGTGNRVGAMAWGTGKLLYIVGINKITADLASAMKRARDEATPPNVLRLDGKAPCASVGHCVNCRNYDTKPCRVTTIMELPPFGRECHVIIVGEPLGY